MKQSLIIFLLMYLMCGCSKTHCVPVESVRTEYRDRVNKVLATDSVTNDMFVYIKGDTVFIRQWRDRWHTKEVHDTIVSVKTDSINVPYPVKKIVEVERKSYWWESALMWIGGTTVFFLSILLLFCYFRRVTKK